MLGIIMLVLFYLVLPAAVLFIVLRNNKSKITAPGAPAGGLHQPVDSLDPMQLAVGTVCLSAVYTGITAVTVLPTWGLGLTDDNLIVGFRVVAGVLVLGLGLALRRLRFTGISLMIVGAVGLLFGVPYVFGNVGSYGILALIGLVLVGLIVLAVKFGHGDKQP